MDINVNSCFLSTIRAILACKFFAAIQAGGGHAINKCTIKIILGKTLNTHVSPATPPTS